MRGIERCLPPPEEHEVLAIFGQARLIRKLDGRLELRGGSEKDRAEAREWMDTFMRRADAGR